MTEESRVSIGLQFFFKWNCFNAQIIFQNLWRIKLTLDNSESIIQGQSSVQHVQANFPMCQLVLRIIKLIYFLANSEALQLRITDQWPWGPQAQAEQNYLTPLCSVQVQWHWARGSVNDPQLYVDPAWFFVCFWFCLCFCLAFIITNFALSSFAFLRFSHPLVFLLVPSTVSLTLLKYILST